MSTRDPARRQSLCMATAEDRRVRLQGYADAQTLDRELRPEGGRLTRLLRRMHVRGRGARRPLNEV